MADNYLEKQMESYQARKAAWEKQKKLKGIKALTPKKVNAAAGATPTTSINK